MIDPSEKVAGQTLTAEDQNLIMVKALHDIVSICMMFDYPKAEDFCAIAKRALKKVGRLDEWYPQPADAPYPRLRELPQEEQEPFWEWMQGQTRPSVDGLPDEDQDYFFPCDYAQWKAGLEPLD